jgi:hypothetical protein
MKYINSVGVELECMLPNYDWYEDVINTIVNAGFDGTRFDISDDGSVCVNVNGISSVELKYWSEDIDELLRFVKFVFSLGFKQNNSCGNHIHFRFKDEILGLLTYNSFYEDFIKKYQIKYKDKVKYINRLTNSFCRYDLVNESNILRQLSGFGNRYSSINFLSLHEHQKTIEFRILPYVTSFREYKGAFNFVVNTINKIIEKLIKNKNIVTRCLVLNDVVNDKILKNIEIVRFNLKRSLQINNEYVHNSLRN